MPTYSSVCATANGRHAPRSRYDAERFDESPEPGARAARFRPCVGGERTRNHRGRTMIDYERGLYVVIEQLANGPAPLPLDHGFGVGAAYRVLGIYNPCESGECWLILSNNDNQLWHISQRHVRTHSLVPNLLDLRMVLAPTSATELRNAMGRG